MSGGFEQCNNHDNRRQVATTTTTTWSFTTEIKEVEEDWHIVQMGDEGDGSPNVAVLLPAAPNHTQSCCSIHVLHCHNPTTHTLVAITLLLADSAKP
jgi:hypothetical protein